MLYTASPQLAIHFNLRSTELPPLFLLKRKLSLASYIVRNLRVRPNTKIQKEIHNAHLLQHKNGPHFALTCSSPILIIIFDFHNHPSILDVAAYHHEQSFTFFNPIFGPLPNVTLTHILSSEAVKAHDIIDETCSSHSASTSSTYLGPLFQSIMALSNQASYPIEFQFAPPSILNTMPSTFSFQDAVDIGSLRSSSPSFFHDGCKQGDGSQNCTASCQDKSAIFSGLDTLRNCMLYSSLANQYATSNVTFPEQYDHYQIHKVKINSDQYKNITTTIQTCLIDYCNITLNTSRCSEFLQEWDSESDRDRDGSPTNLTSSFYRYVDTASYSSTFRFCNFVPGSFNADIGGIGV